MKKVMIVDDEILIRENIRHCVDWTKEGFIYCGDASDGEVALPLIEEYMPDILITDIKMPFMDGLELTSIVRKQMPEIKVIVMSGHDEFRYAQNAIRLGVEDYCLKPVSPSELIELLQKVSKKIDEEQQRKKNQSITREKLFSDLCGGLISTSEAIESAKELSLSLSARFYAVLTFDIRGINNDPQSPSVMIAILHMLASENSSDIDTLSYARSRTKIVCILKGNSAEQLIELQNNLSEHIQSIAKMKYACETYVGFGSVQERIQGIHVSYLEAEEDKYIMRLTQQNRTSLIEMGDHWHMDIMLDRGKFLEFLKIGVPSQKDRFIHEFASSLKPLNWKSSYGFYLLNDLTLEAFRTAKQSFSAGLNPSDSIERLQQKIQKITTWEHCIEFLGTLLHELWQWRAESSDKYGDIISHVKKYILEQYQNDHLSLKLIASHVKISPSHLSKIFSQETGQTLTEYMTQVRINKAMELIKTTRSKSFEVAFDVGYNDPHYFSKLFKKVTGMTPKEYRNQGVINENDE